MSHERKREEQKQKLKRLQNVWQDQGAVKFDEQFHDVSDKIMGQLKKTIKKLESDYTTPYNGTIPRISNKTYHMQKVSASEEAKLLLLSSGNNQLAEEIKDHLKVKYDVCVVRGPHRNSNLASLQSILSQIDNVPSWYKVRNFSKQLLHFIIVNHVYLKEKLDIHLRKMNVSYKDMSMRLYDQKELGNCIDFVVAAAGVMLDIPILMVQPTQHKVLDTDRVYYKFHEIKMREQDKHLPAHLHKIWLVFNGIDTFIPFMKKEIGHIVNISVAAMRQICDTYTSVKDLVRHIPNQTIIKGTVTDILGHLRAAAKIAATTKFNCGDALTNPETGVQPDIDISDKVVTRKCKNTDQTASTSSKKRTECTDENNENINVEVSTSHESTNRAVDTNLDEATSNLAPRKEIPRRVDCDRDENQCHCGLRLKSSDEYEKHLNRAHKNNFWLCSGMNHLDDGTVEKCKEICTKRSSLWSHFRRQHESHYHNYCDIKGCYYGSDEKWSVVKHKFNIHNVPMPEENKCPRCTKAFGQMSKLTKHLVTCQTDARPFACIECGKDFCLKESFTRHMK